MTSDITASYRSAERMARNRARNFYYSFIVLPPEKRRAFCAVYSFMRCCDDISDGTATAEEKRTWLERWRANLEQASRGEVKNHPILPAFHDTLRRFSIPKQYFHWIIDGAEMDLTTHRYDTFEALYRYCFNVASAVGLVSIQIFGYTEESAKRYAEFCGVAFQLTNILRDLKEDAQMGRIYLPREDLERFHYQPEDLQNGIMDDRFRQLMVFQTERAKSYYDQARQLLPLVEKASQPALWAMMEIYGRILKKIVQHQFDVFGHCVGLSGAEKLVIAFRALTMRIMPAALVHPE